MEENNFEACKNIKLGKILMWWYFSRKLLKWTKDSKLKLKVFVLLDRKQPELFIFD